VKLDSNNEFGTELLLTLDSGPKRYIKDVNSRILPFEQSWKSFLDWGKVKDAIEETRRRISRIS
jgi:hypothetical protein